MYEHRRVLLPASSSGVNVPLNCSSTPSTVEPPRNVTLLPNSSPGTTTPRARARATRILEKLVMIDRCQLSPLRRKSCVTAMLRWGNFVGLVYINISVFRTTLVVVQGNTRATTYIRTRATAPACRRPAQVARARPGERGRSAAAGNPTRYIQAQTNASLLTRQTRKSTDDRLP